MIDKFSEYQHQIIGLRSHTEDAIIFPVLKLSEEAGEVSKEVAHIIKTIGLFNQMSQKDKERIAKELGDVLGCVTYIAADIGYTLNMIAEMHIEKIRQRKSERENTKDNG